MTPATEYLIRGFEERIARRLKDWERYRELGRITEASLHRGWADATAMALDEFRTYVSDESATRAFRDRMENS